MANMQQDLIKKITSKQLKTNLPNFSAGDTVKVHTKIKEGNKERIQMFEGVVIKRQGSGIGQTFTVRKIASGVGVEKTFPVHAVTVPQIEILKKGKVRQSKIFYLKNLSGKAARIKEDTSARK